MKNLLLRFALSAAALLAPAFAADVPISGLPAISSVQAATVVPVVDVAGTPTTKKATVSQLIAGLPAVTSGADGKMIAADKAKLDAATASGTASTLVYRDGSANFAANAITAAQVTGLAAPTNATDAANKAYVDAAAAGLVIKTPGVAATAGSNVTLAGGAPTTLDGITLHANDRVLVKDQTDAKENGIYFVQTLGSGANGTWARTTDADTGAELVTGSYIFITGGTVNVQSSWTMVTPGTIVIGTSDITWNLFSQTTQILASNIIGQIVGAQIQNSAINTAKFAAGITPVEIVSSLPVTGNFAGRTVYYTVDGKLYRYNGSSFVASVPSTDLTGQITTTQITDNSVTTAKVNAGAVTTAKLAAGAVTANELAANSVVSGKIAAGAISATEIAAGAITTVKFFAGAVDTNALAANAVTAAKIQAGTITADRLTISTLSSITANIGTITSGSLTSSTSITVGSGKTAVTISSSQFSIGDIGITAFGSIGTQLNAITSSNQATLYSTSSEAAVLVQNNSTGSGITMFASGLLRINSTNGILNLSGSAQMTGPGSILSIPGNSDSINFVFGQYGSAGTQDGYIGIILNGVAKKIPFYSF